MGRPPHPPQSEEELEEFEQLVGELLRALDIADVEVTAYHGDKGIDARGVYELASGLVVRVAVQAKRQQSNVDRTVVAHARTLEAGSPREVDLLPLESRCGV